MDLNKKGQAKERVTDCPAAQTWWKENAAEPKGQRAVPLRTLLKMETRVLQSSREFSLSWSWRTPSKCPVVTGNET
jgi:hypothetical protein